MNIGKLVKYLEGVKSEYGDNISVIYQADHGQSFEFQYGNPIVGWLDPEDIENWCSLDEFEEDYHIVNAVWI